MRTYRKMLTACLLGFGLLLAAGAGQMDAHADPQITTYPPELVSQETGPGPGAVQETTAPETEAAVQETTAQEQAITLVQPSEAQQQAGEIRAHNGCANGELVTLRPEWTYADSSKINSGAAVMYVAQNNRRNKIIAVNAGHGTKGGSSVRTYCHPDRTAKLTGGSTEAGAVTATAVSYGMTFRDGTSEATVTLRTAQILKEMLLAEGYDVLMIRDGADVQLDNIARTVISNNMADVHIALHWDGDGLSHDKGVYYMSVPDRLKYMEPVKSCWQAHEALGDALIAGLAAEGCKVWNNNPLDTDLTQTSYSTVPSVDIELGNQCSDHSDATLQKEAAGLVRGLNSYFGS